MRWLLRAAGLPLALVPSVALPLLLVAAAEDRAAPPAVEEAYRALPELPSAAPADRVADLEDAAVELAARLRAVPLAETGEEICPADRLTVSWTEPGDGYGWGAHLDPVGPAPTAATKAVNGVVLCAGAPYAFMGFEAWRTDGDWHLAAVPYVHEEHEEHAPAPAAPQPVEAPVDAPAAPKPPVPAAPAPLSLDLPVGAIEGYAAYEPQRLCDPTPKPGTLALRNLLLGNNPGTRNLGISRSCGAGGQSEHKEGRALDWGVLVSRASEKAAAERFIGQLMATDEQGNRHAMARRMGVMYVIWNRQIWSAYRASAGWRPYGGASPHTDHVHVSLSWAGAQGRTSFWSGKVDPSTLLAYQPPAPSGGSGAAPAPSGGGGKRGVTLPVGTLPTEAVGEAVREGGRRGKDDGEGRKRRDGKHAADRRRWEDLSAEEQAALIAWRDAERARRAEAEADSRAEGEHRKVERGQDRRGRGGDRDGHGGDRRRDGEDDDAERAALRQAERTKRHAEEQRRQAEEAARRAAEAGRQAAAAPAPGAPAPAAPAPHGGHGGRGHGDGHRGDGAAIREAHRQAEAQRQAERQQQREAQKQAEAQRQAERQQQRDAQKQAERQRRAEVEQQRSRHRQGQARAGKRHGKGGGEHATQGQGGGGQRGGKGHGGGKRHGGGKGRG